MLHIVLLPYQHTEENIKNKKNLEKNLYVGQSWLSVFLTGATTHSKQLSAATASR